MNFDGDAKTVTVSDASEGARFWSVSEVSKFLKALDDAPVDPEVEAFEDPSDSFDEEPILIIPVGMVIGEEPVEDDVTKDYEGKHIVAVENEVFGALDIMSDGKVKLTITEDALVLKLS